MPTRVKPGGWGFAEKLTSPQITQLDANAGNALDRLDAGVERIRRVASVPNVRAIPYLTLTERDVLYLNGFGLYRFDLDSSAPHNPPAVIAPDSNPASGRWLWDLARSGPTRIPATSVQRGLVYAHQERSASPVVFSGNGEVKTLGTGIPASAIHCQPGDIVHSTLSCRIAGYNSMADATNDVYPNSVWDYGTTSLTVRARGGTLTGSDPLAIMTSWVNAAGRHTFDYSYTDSGKELWNLYWEGVFSATPAFIGIHDIRIHTTVIRP